VPNYGKATDRKGAVMSDKCKSCGKPFTAHLGLEGTCRELIEAKAILDKLPVTKDGVRVVPFTPLYGRSKNSRGIRQFQYWPDLTHVAFDWNEYGPDVVIDVSAAYSSFAAAQAKGK
jgi:hypothetical protein